jgi:methionyl-tRNA synthetase
VTPAGNVCNEFYDLDGEKFSTSRNHLIKAGALLAEVPRDLVRFYLALTGPEYQRTNFTRDLLESVTQRQLVGPWNALADAVDAAVHNINVSAGARADGDWIVELPTTESGRRRAAAMVQRFRLCYDLADYSPSRAAGNLIGQLGRLVDLAGHIAPGDLLLAVRTLVACAAPILIDVAEQLATARVDLALTDEPADSVAVFRLPRIGAGVGAGRLVGVAA